MSLHQLFAVGEKGCLSARQSRRWNRQVCSLLRTYNSGLRPRLLADRLKVSSCCIILEMLEQVMGDSTFMNRRLGWSNRLPTAAFILLLILFFLGTSLTAANLRGGIIPDEGAHTMLIGEFEKTPGIPPETEATIKRGVFIEGNPFLYYWLAARLRNLLTFIVPSASARALFYLDRFFNVFSGGANLVAVWVISRKVIKNVWLQLLPPFLLANILMFFFLSSGSNYDNLHNLLCSISILFAVRLVKGEDFWRNSFWLFLVLGLAGLTKKTAIPLIGILMIVWLVIFIDKKPQWHMPQGKKLILFVLALAAIAMNVFMYGRNLLVYKTLIPGCNQLATETQCLTSNFIVREKEYALEEKMTIQEAVAEGYPDPVSYYFGYWSRVMVSRNVGVHGHKIYSNPLKDIVRFTLLGLVVIGLAFFRKPPKEVLLLVAIAVAYTLTLFVYNYDMQLYYAFQGFAIQGRYVFPVVSCFLILIAHLLEILRPKALRIAAIFYVVILSITAGPLQIIYYYRSFFTNWF